MKERQFGRWWCAKGQSRSDSYPDAHRPKGFPTQQHPLCSDLPGLTLGLTPGSRGAQSPTGRGGRRASPAPSPSRLCVPPSSSRAGSSPNPAWLMGTGAGGQVAELEGGPSMRGGRERRQRTTAHLCSTHPCPPPQASPLRNGTSRPWAPPRPATPSQLGAEAPPTHVTQAGL